MSPFRPFGPVGMVSSRACTAGAGLGPGLVVAFPYRPVPPAKTTLQRVSHLACPLAVQAVPSRCAARRAKARLRLSSLGHRSVFPALRFTSTAVALTLHLSTHLPRPHLDVIAWLHAGADRRATRSCGHIFAAAVHALPRPSHPIWHPMTCSICAAPCGRCFSFNVASAEVS